MFSNFNFSSYSFIFYLFKVEKFSALSQEEYDKTRDLVLKEVEQLLEGQLEQEGNQPNDDLKKYYIN